ncbi:hypothetical protein GCM10023170_093490 [Phytohabitans houttuyneae]|uniref:Uncharacterized protein n=1 Tax=Phytohabitans houttuyneae TaxID=1076126 RepID=A0A6V8KWK5_9ACTN|nr:hypothetical protein Phou_091550 [Phytohabitans houttuyneae]
MRRSPHPAHTFEEAARAQVAAAAGCGAGAAPRALPALVRTAFWAKAPGWIGTDPADLEGPYVEVTVPPTSRSS